MAKKTKKISFESAMEELEIIVNELESGDLPLEEAIKKYELGVKNSMYCSELLDKTEKKITILLKDSDGKINEELFDNK
jgi:exodeoxyribonuclease VII small subunit